MTTIETTAGHVENPAIGFLAAFAYAAGISNRAEADAQWAGYSRQLSDCERARIEAEGAQGGAREGEAFKTMFG